MKDMTVWMKIANGNYTINPLPPTTDRNSFDDGLSFVYIIWLYNSNIRHSSPFHDFRSPL